MGKLKVGDFVKHKESKNIIFQIVQILENVKKGDSRMLNCIRVTDVHAYLETDMNKYHNWITYELNNLILIIPICLHRI